MRTRPFGGTISAMGAKMKILRPAGSRRGVAYFFIFALMCLCISLGAFLGERIALFSDHPNSFMNPAEFYSTFAAAVLSYAALIAVIRRNFRLKIAWGWLLFFLVLGVGNAIGTFAWGPSFSGFAEFEHIIYYYEWTFEIADKIQYALCFFLACAYFCLFFAILPKVLPHTRWIRSLGWIAVLFAIAAIIYSLCAEWHFYQDLFEPQRSVPSYWTKSFTNNENTFAFLIFIAVACLCMLHNSNSHLFYWMLILVMGIFQIFVLSATGIVCTWLLILCYGFYRFIHSLKHKPVRSAITFLLLVAFTIAATVMIFTDAFGPGSFFTKIHDQITSYTGPRNSAFETRVDTWNMVFGSLTHPLYWLFGAGEWQSRLYLSLIHVGLANGVQTYPAHNTLMQCLIDGGLLKVVLYLILSIRFFYVCILRISDKSKIALPILFVFIALLLHGIMESDVFLNMDTKGFAQLLFLFLPLEIEYFQAKHPAIKQYLEDYRVDAYQEKAVYRLSPVTMGKVAFLFLTPLSVLGIGVGGVLSIRGMFGMQADWSYYGLFLVAFLLGPLAFYATGYAKKRKAAVSWLIVPFVFSLIAGIGFMWFNIIYTRVAFFVLIGVCLLPVILHLGKAISKLGCLVVRAYLPHLALGGVSAGLFFALLAIPETAFSHHIVAVSGIGFLFLYGMLANAFKLTFPVNELFHRFDCHLTALSLVREDRLGKKQFKRFYPDYQPPHPKRVYAYRLD